MNTVTSCCIMCGNKDTLRKLVQVAIPSKHKIVYVHSTCVVTKKDRERIYNILTGIHSLPDEISSEKTIS